MPKHSPGPWKFNLKPTEDGALVAITTPSGHCLHAIETSEGPAGNLHENKVPMSAEELIADFRVMAAAPALLESLVEIVMWVSSHCSKEETYQMLVRAHNAVASAHKP